MPDAIVLAIAADNAEAILDGQRAYEYRTRPPARLPARAYLAVSGTAEIVGECELGPPARHTAKGWALPVTRPRRYRSPRALGEFGLARTPRSFRYVPG
ncbi:MAG: hypothetical protein M3O91_07250 [Chloroflexota bacterium]|nr:hypothetical protein [Chloroflexota bacterium]